MGGRESVPNSINNVGASCRLADRSETSMVRFISASRSFLVLALLAALLTAGCGSEAPKFLEPRDIGDKVTEADLDSFLQVVDNLPEKKLPEMPPIFKRPPSWDEQRTLPVNELVREENDELEKLWNDETLIRSLTKDRASKKPCGSG